MEIYYTSLTRWSIRHKGVILMRDIPTLETAKLIMKALPKSRKVFVIPVFNSSGNIATGNA